MRLVPIECIREGCILGKNIYDENGRVLLKTGVTLTDTLLKRIRALNIFSIYIVDKYSESEIEDIIKPELRQKTIFTLKQTFKNIHSLISDNKVSNNPKKAIDLLKKQDSYLNSIQEMANELLENILENKNLLVSLVDIKSLDNYTYQHSVNVAVLSLVLGVSLNLKRHELLDLCTGALLHDIGKIFVPEGILNKPGKLTHDEFDLLKKHPFTGYDYLTNQYSLKTLIKIIVLQHHERVDGNGYPEGLKSDKIHTLSKIVSIADVYDALTSDRPYRRALCASDALEYIMANAGSMFDFDIATVFSRVIVPFPSGTIVKLSNGDIGVVKETLTNYPLRPTVKIVKSLNQNTEGTLIRLIDTLSLVVSSVEHTI